MCGKTCKEGAGPIGLKTICNRFGGQQSTQPEAGHQQRMSWNGSDRTKYRPRKFLPILDERLDETGPRGSIGAQGILSIFQIAVEHYSAAIFEWMRKRGRRMNPIKPVRLQG